MLSACSTGWRPQAAEHIELTGDDILGLPSALLEAGARSIVVSIPKAIDDVTREFMVAYHRRRAGGDTPLVAFAAPSSSSWRASTSRTSGPASSATRCAEVALGSDIVVLIPGITGSVLERNGSEVWGASAGSRPARPHQRRPQRRGPAFSRTMIPAVDDLGDGVRATRLVDDVHLFPGLWTIDGYTKVASACASG